MSDTDNQHSTSPPRPLREGERSGYNMANIIERLSFMAAFGVATRLDLQVLLAIGEAGGVISFEKLLHTAMKPDAFQLRMCLSKLADKSVNAEGSVIVSADAATITLTNSGREACNVWNLPLAPLGKEDLKMEEMQPATLEAAEVTPFETYEFTGKVSHFGGPRDTGVSPSENLALYPDVKGVLPISIFLPSQPAGTTGTARRLNPDAYYIAMRWAYKSGERGTNNNGLGVRLPITTPRSWLLQNFVRVLNPRTGKEVLVRAVDWGPNGRTNRLADVSPGVMRELGLQTDDLVKVSIKVLKEAPLHAA